MVERSGYRLVSALVVFVKALLIAGGLVFLAEHFGWRFVSEAGGSVATTLF